MAPINVVVGTIRLFELPLLIYLMSIAAFQVFVEVQFSEGRLVDGAVVTETMRRMRAASLRLTVLEATGIAALD